MKRKTIGSALMLAGTILLLGALALACVNLMQDQRAAESTQSVLEALELLHPELAQTRPEQEQMPMAAQQETELQEQAVSAPDYVENPEAEMPVAQVDAHNYIGILSIPAINITLPVISHWSDENLRYAPCRYAGSAYLDDLVIAGHNYRAHFGSLGALRLGDSVSFTDMDGNVFSYVVADVETLPDTAVEEMTAGDWPLTLFTCTPGREKRITIRCDRAPG